MAEPTRPRVQGPLAAYADGYWSELARLGYTPFTRKNMLIEMAQLSRWLSAEGFEVTAITPQTVAAFCAARQSTGHKRPSHGRALLSYLTMQGAMPNQATSVAPCPVEAMVKRYRRYLIETKGLSERTVDGYQALARRFLHTFKETHEHLAALDSLNGADITAFLLNETARLGVATAKDRASKLRSLLRYLHLHDLIGRDMSSAVPPAACWRDTGLPPKMNASQVIALLDSCDRSQPTGLRDYAILTILARLGLRSAEVAGLKLEDIDWRGGEILVRGKGRREERMPLPTDVGEAIVAYIRTARPRTECGSLFLTRYAPVRGLDHGGITQVVFRAGARIGLVPVRAHRLRHALATELLRRGATLPEIGQVLRHRGLGSTVVYAKVDRSALRAVAHPWPGATR